ncbi:ubiquitin conjugating protein, putative [Bodo saltans]|uniref:Ubiquitin conjugating protein, putative n=1 Tax=Bodo saltans TaxID=75058 RepID=A0A0S4ISF8_BODSA|nr:ubiquitin conjugating protein, putative [Bodo saltans]|eukprot:CUE86367.1 ubiquitin conjugating protein, putative [Bodo saltans]
MASEIVEAWLSDGERNFAGLFADDDLKPPRPGWVTVTPDGEHAIHLNASPPFDIEFPPSLWLLDQVRGIPANSLGERLDQIGSALTKGDEGDTCDYDDEVEYHDDAASRAQCVVQQQMRDAASAFDISSLAGAAVERILRDLVTLRDVAHDGWSAAPLGRNLSLWHVEFFGFEEGTPLRRDFEALRASGGPQSIILAMKFPTEYPFRPPFIRIVKPRFAFRTGRVTVGGSICTQLLTDEGWNPTFDVESLLVSIRAQITDPEANARIDLSNHTEYTEEEAIAAFIRVAAQHKREGW